MTNALSLRSSQPAAIDRLREEEASTALQIAGIAGFTLLMVLSAQMNFRLFLWEVPITLQTLVVYGSGLYLGARNGMITQALYLTLGLFLPVFAGDGFGTSYLLGAASAGYLLSYPFAAAIIGALSKQWKTLPGSTLASLIGAALIFTSGVVWLHFVAGHATWMESIDKGFLRFIAIDALKVVVIGLLYSGTRSIFRK